jgi:ABC-type uncharacterized transport system involved in gliding motility auxiliary subunit
MPRKSKRNRILTYGSNTVISSIFFLGILIIIALIAERHPWRMDLTETGAYTLSEQTRNILKSLDKSVQIKGFFATASPEQAKAKDLLDTYRYFDGKINYELIDPDRQPEVAKRYEIRAYGTLVLEGYGKQESIQTVDEESITNALLKLTRNEQKKVYFLIGHGERTPENADKDGYSIAQSALQKANYATPLLNLLQQPQVPDDAAAIVIAGPRKPLMSQEIESLRAYLGKGGKVLAFLDPSTDGGLKEFLESYGVQLDDSIVVDKLSRVFGGSYLMPVVTEYGTHRIAANFEVATFYSEARSVRPVEDPPENVQVEILASTSPNAWGELDLEMIEQGQAGFDEGKDIPGPVPLAVISEIETTEPIPNAPEKAREGEEGQDEKQTEEANQEKPAKTAYLLVVGDSEFADNTYFELSGNGDFFLNMINFMAEEENLITIKRREREGNPVLMTHTQASWVLVVLLLAPLLVLASGLVVYRVRRSQR